MFDRDGYVAGAAESRAAAIRAALGDDSVARDHGGRAAATAACRSCRGCDPADVRRARKPFVGYSDLTSLLTF